MSVTRELLDALKASDGGLSDYRVAKIIGVGQSTMTKYNKNELPLSPDKVLFICELIGFDAVDWLLRLYRERARCDREKAVLDTLRTRMAA
jgi:hypothetical protein